jgi:hypothetical protein
LSAAFLLGFVPSYAVYALAPLVADLSVLGLARAAYVPFAFFAVFMQGVGLFLLPAMSGRSFEIVRGMAVRAACGLGSLGSVWAILIVILVPDGLGQLLLADAWDLTQEPRAYFGVGVFFQALALPALIALRALQAPRRVLVVNAVVAPLVLSSGLLLTSTSGAGGLALGVMLGDVSMALLAWWQLARLKAARNSAVE